MNPSDVTLIHFGHDRSKLAASATAEVLVPVGAGAPAQRLFRHDTPTSGEIEQVIEAVEDALAMAGLRHAERSDLRTTNRFLLDFLGLRQGHARVTRDQVELAFEGLAMPALGRSLMSREGAATLIILRECMHHLGFAGLRRGEE